MKVKKVLSKLNFLLDEEELAYLAKKTNWFVSLLKKEISGSGVGAEVFVGGSFSKGTLTKSNEYDVDIFVRFDSKYKNLSGELEKLLKGFCGKASLNLEKIHGSRDYFMLKDGKFRFEVVPVLKINKVKNAENVTDLSYFHVNYVAKKTSAKTRREISLAKKFCEAQGVYGAESYIQGFSGYALECLIIYFKSFEKMLNELVKIKEGEKKIIDPERQYRRNADVLVEINESKLNSPVILIDPIHRERNVLAGLNQESFLKFQNAARRFLRSPSKKFFYSEEINIGKLAAKGELVRVTVKTDRQPGDIAGSKMKKFSNYLVREIEKYFNVLKSVFNYKGIGQEAELCLILKMRGEILKRGPPLNKKEHVKEFKIKNKNVFTKNGRLYAKIKVNTSGKKFVGNFVEKHRKKINEMNIVSVGVS